MLRPQNKMYNGEKLQRTEKDGGKFVCRHGLGGRNPQEEDGRKNIVANTRNKYVDGV